MKLRKTRKTTNRFSQSGRNYNWDSKPALPECKSALQFVQSWGQESIAELLHKVRFNTECYKSFSGRLDYHPPFSTQQKSCYANLETLRCQIINILTGIIKLCTLIKLTDSRALLHKSSLKFSVTNTFWYCTDFVALVNRNAHRRFGKNTRHHYLICKTS